MMQRIKLFFYILYLVFWAIGILPLFSQTVIEQQVRDKKVVVELDEIDKLIKKVFSEKDDYIDEFVKSIKNKRVIYDGRVLTLYNTPSLSEAFFSIIKILLSIAGLGGAVICLRDVPLGAILGFLISSWYFFENINKLGKDIKYSFWNVPLLTLSDKGIKFDNNVIAWKDVKRIGDSISKKVYEFFTTQEHVISLYSANNNALLTLVNVEDHLPITTDNLIALLGHYIDKKKQKI